MGTDLHSIVELPAMPIHQAKSLADRLSNCDLTAELLHHRTYPHPMLEKQDKDGMIKDVRKLIVFPHGSTYEEAQRQLSDFSARLASELPTRCAQKVYGLGEAVR